MFLPSENVRRDYKPVDLPLLLQRPASNPRFNSKCVMQYHLRVDSYTVFAVFALAKSMFWPLSAKNALISSIGYARWCWQGIRTRTSGFEASPSTLVLMISNYLQLLLNLGENYERVYVVNARSVKVGMDASVNIGGLRVYYFRAVSSSNGQQKKYVVRFNFLKYLM